jgi:hypothetical protein
MGFNHKAAGFDSVLTYVQAMCISEREHLKAFVNLISSDADKQKALIEKNWTTFARLYNGKNYKKNNYDKKIKVAYEMYSR